MADPITLEEAARAGEDAAFWKRISESDNYVEESPNGIDKRTVSGMNEDVDNLISATETLAEEQRAQFSDSFDAQFMYAWQGNISDYAGQQLTEAQKLWSFEYPDGSDDYYGTVQSQDFPITIPSDPKSDPMWGKVNGISTEEADNRYAATFKNDDYGSAVDNMIAGRINGSVTITHSVGNKYSTGGTSWEVVSSVVSDISAFIALTAICALDYNVTRDKTSNQLQGLQQAALDAETVNAEYHIPGGDYGIDGTLTLMESRAIRVYGDGIRNTVFYKLSDNTGIVVSKTGVDNGIVEDLQVYGRGGNNPSENTNENTAGVIFYRKMERVNIMVSYCSGPNFTDPLLNHDGATDLGYGVALLNDDSNTNNTKNFEVFCNRCYGDALFIDVISGTRDCNGMQAKVRSFNCTGFAVNAQKGFRNRFNILSAQGDYHTGVCLAADTDNEFNIQYVESGDFSIGARANAARNEFNFFDASSITVPYEFNNANNTYRDMVTRTEYISGTPIKQFQGTSRSYPDGIRLGGVSSSNLLSIYEEGTWTVELHDALDGGNVSTTKTIGYYTRVGNKVTCSFINLSNIDTAGLESANTVYITLPTETSSVTSKGISLGDVITNFLTYPSTATELACSSVQGSDKAILNYSGDGISTGGIDVVHIVSGVTDIARFTLTYFVD